MKFAPLALGALLAVAAQPALALGAGYTLVIDDDLNLPVFTLTNDSDSAEITGFRFTIGDTGYNFDFVDRFTYTSSESMTAEIVTGGTGDGGVRTDEFDIDFTGFQPSEEFSLRADVDRGNEDYVANLNEVFWNNGASPNSVMEVTFSNGEVLSQVAPDPAEDLSSYTFSQSSPAAVPLPATLPLMGAGLALGGLMLRRRHS